MVVELLLERVEQLDALAEAVQTKLRSEQTLHSDPTIQPCLSVSHTDLHTATCPTSNRVRAFTITETDSNANCSRKYRMGEVQTPHSSHRNPLLYHSRPCSYRTCLEWLSTILDESSTARQI